MATMRLAHARQGLNNAVTYLSKAIQVQNTMVSEIDRTISWGGRTPGILKGIFYPLEYQFLLDRQQYSVLLSDGSFFQFYYLFDTEGELRQARLAFFPPPVSTRDSIEDLWDAAEGALDRDDQQLYDHLYNWTEWLEIKQRAPSNTSHIRFDFDRDVTSHCQAHIQFSGVQELRVPADFVPQPLAFVQLCETMLSGIGTIDDVQLGFERNNILSLARPNQLIALGHIATPP